MSMNVVYGVFANEPPHNPFALFSNRECRAWIAALLALRAQPQRDAASSSAATTGDAAERGEVDDLRVFTAAVPFATLARCIARPDETQPSIPSAAC